MLFSKFIFLIYKRIVSLFLLFTASYRQFFSLLLEINLLRLIFFNIKNFYIWEKIITFANEKIIELKYTLLNI